MRLKWFCRKSQHPEIFCLIIPISPLNNNSLYWTHVSRYSLQEFCAHNVYKNRDFVQIMCEISAQNLNFYYDLCVLHNIVCRLIATAKNLCRSYSTTWESDKSQYICSYDNFIKNYYHKLSLLHRKIQATEKKHMSQRPTLIPILNVKDADVRYCVEIINELLVDYNIPKNINILSNRFFAVWRVSFNDTIKNCVSNKIFCCCDKVQTNNSRFWHCNK